MAEVCEHGHHCTADSLWCYYCLMINARDYVWSDCHAYTISKTFDEIKAIEDLGKSDAESGNPMFDCEPIYDYSKMLLGIYQDSYQKTWTPPAGAIKIIKYPYNTTFGEILGN